MKIFVTGSKGFIGKALVERLKREGHEIVGYDLPDDIYDFENLKNKMKGCKAVYHLAALIDETKGKEELFRVNAKCTETVLDAAIEENIERIIYLSTVGIHGELNEIVDEKSKIAPVTVYEKSKAEAEKIVSKYHELANITILRSALVYGANGYWRNIVKFVAKGFPIIGDGENKWQMAYVDDIVDALVFVLDRNDTFGETYVVAEKEAHKFSEIYCALQKELGKVKEIKYMPVWFAMILAYWNLLVCKLTGKKSILIPQHVKRLLRERVYNTDKIRRLGWKAKVDLEKGIKMMVGELKNE